MLEKNKTADFFFIIFLLCVISSYLTASPKSIQLDYLDQISGGSSSSYPFQFICAKNNRLFAISQKSLYYKDVATNGVAPILIGTSGTSLVLDMSADENYIAVGLSTGFIQIRATDNPTIVYASYNTGLTNFAWISFSYDAKSLITAHTNRVNIWSLSSNSLSLLNTYNVNCLKVLFADKTNTRFFGISSTAKTIDSYYFSGSSIQTTNILSESNTIADFSIDSKYTYLVYLATTLGSNTPSVINFWVISAKIQLWSMSGFASQRVIFSPYDNFVAVGYKDPGSTITYIRVIEVSSPGTAIAPSFMTGRTNVDSTNQVSGIHFSSKENKVVVSTVNNFVKIFNIRCSCTGATAVCPSVFTLTSCCHSSCKTCFDSTTTGCTSCSSTSNNFLLNLKENSCVDNCPANLFYDCSANSCYCSYECKTCDGPASNNCLSCDSTLTNYQWFYPEERVCSSACPSTGRYVSGQAAGICPKCDDSCQTCDGTTANNCLSCDKCEVFTDKPWYYEGEKRCVSSCPSGTFISDNTNKYCQKCHETCETCSGPGDRSCLTCDSCGIVTEKIWYDQIENSCSSSCPEGTYISNESKKLCAYCSPDCKTCSGFGDHKCLSCDKCGILSNKIWFFEEEGTCTWSCPEGTYAADADSKVCRKCHADCETCSGPGNHNCLSCDKCEIRTDKSWYYELEKTCLISCPSGSFISDYENKYSKKCHETCETCSGPGDHSCLSCDSCGIVTENMWYDQIEKTCSSSCSGGTYISNDSKKICAHCFPDCETCSGPGDHNCISCDSCGVLVDKMWISEEWKTCTPTCPEGTYETTAGDTKRCKKCHEDCQTCSGPGDHSCLSCDQCEVTTDKSWFYELERTCTASCPQGSFVSDSTNKFCKKCHETCETCSGSGDHSCISCDTCGLVTENMWYDHIEKTCLSSCFAGTYISSDSGKLCAHCSPDCETCSGPGDHNCKSCDTCGVVSDKIWLFEEWKTCTSSCPEGTYEVTEGNKKQCIQCHEDCQTCSGPGDHSCLICDQCEVITDKSWFYELERTCTASCPRGSFVSDSTKKFCQKCHETCETCSGLGDHSCLSCDSCGIVTQNMWYDHVEKTCLSTCFAGTYISSDSEKLCAHCSPDCETCSGPGDHNCISCDTCGVVSDKMWIFEDSKTCTSTCPEGTYETTDGVTKKCTKCHADCTSCDGSTVHSCLSCDSCGLTTHRIWFNEIEKSCTSVCPEGTYISDFNEKLCSKCHPNCNSCSGPGDHNCESCDVCGVTTINIWQLPHEKTCQQICPSGTYAFDDNNKICAQCHEDCETCSGPGNNDCLSCDSCGTTNTKVWYLSIDKSCFSSCPPGTYIKDDLNKLCEKCHADCLTCAGPGDHSCLTCPSEIWNYPVDQTCHAECPPGTFASDLANKICAKCHDDCETCSGPDSRHCETCNLCAVTQNKSWYYGNENSCNEVCPAGTYPSDSVNKLCSKCNTECRTCFGPTRENCLSCDIAQADFEHFWPKSNTCTISCPLGSYLQNPALFLCADCDPACTLCKGPTSDDCTDCFENCVACTFSTETCTKCARNFYLYNEIAGQQNNFQYCLAPQEAVQSKFLFKADSDGSGISKDCGKNCVACISETICTQCRKRSPFGAWLYRK